MTRVTENMMFTAVSQGIAAGQERLMRAQKAAASGKKVSRPSDNPVAAARTAVLNASLKRIDSMESVAQRTQLKLSTVQSVLRDSNGALVRARELAVFGASGHLSANDRVGIAEEIDALRSSLLDLANTRIGNSYLFSGFKVDTQPFAADGSYQGDSGSQELEVAPGVLVSGNTPGDQTFTLQNGQTMFEVLAEVRDALRRNDPEAVASGIGVIERAREQVNQMEVRNGFAVQRVETSTGLRAELKESLALARSEVSELDMAEGYTELLKAQMAYQSAIAETSRLLNTMTATMG